MTHSEPPRARDPAWSPGLSHPSVLAPLLIVGASARAAAWSAVRAGLPPAAADLFADRDLAAVAPCVRVERGSYPDGLIGAADALPPGPWMYTGALENRPDLIERLAFRRPLWGNGPESVRAVRDPVAVAEALRAADLPAVEVRLSPRGLPRDGSWLRKPLASAGGYGVVAYGAGRGDTNAVPTGSCYYQRRMIGPGLSAVFVAWPGGASLEGVTRQLIGRPEIPFAYRGTLAPRPIPPDVWKRIEDIGAVLATRFGLVGLFGVDLVTAGGLPWVVEVNPRYTAAVEVIELALGRSLLDAHRRACEGQTPDRLLPPADRPTRFVAKEIVFAVSDGVFGDFDDPGATAADPYRVPRAADLPQTGTPFKAGEPVLTVFAVGPSPEETLRTLAERVRATGAWLRGS